MRLPNLTHYATAVFITGAALFVSTVDSGALSVLDRLGFRIGFVLLITGGLTMVALRVRRLTADDLERARQAGFDRGYELGCEARCEIVDMDSARAGRSLSVAERGAAHQFGQ